MYSVDRNVKEIIEQSVSGCIIQRLYTRRPSRPEEKRRKAVDGSGRGDVAHHGKRPEASPRLRARRGLGDARRIIGSATHVVEARLLSDHVVKF